MADDCKQHDLSGCRVLVTGGAGFIGSHVVEHLLVCGAEVVVFDNLSGGSLENLPRHLLGWRLIEGDVTDVEAVTRATESADAVVHLAALVSVEDSLRNPAASFSNNAHGSFNIFEAVRRCGLPRHVVYASSSAVYGSNSDLPCLEAAPLRPCSPYGADKVYAEMLGQVYSASFGIGSIGLRFFNVYGPRQRADSAYSGVISKFVRQASWGRNITIFGDGEQTRDFIYVSDVAKAVVSSLQHLKVRSGGINAIYNVGTGKSITINQLASTVIRCLGRRCAILHAEERLGEVRDSKADIHKIVAELGWGPVIALESGLRELILSTNTDSSDRKSF